MKTEATFLMFSDEARRFLAENDIDDRELIARTGQPLGVGRADDPSQQGIGRKELTTVLLASAAVVAAATPALREIIHALSGRDTIIREKRLVAVEDGAGNIVLGADGEPILHWVEVAKTVSNPEPAQPILVKGFGIEISFGGRSDAKSSRGGIKRR